MTIKKKHGLFLVFYQKLRLCYWFSLLFCYCFSLKTFLTHVNRLKISCTYLSINVQIFFQQSFTKFRNVHYFSTKTWAENNILNSKKKCEIIKLFKDICIFEFSHCICLFLCAISVRKFKLYKRYEAQRWKLLSYKFKYIFIHMTKCTDLNYILLREAQQRIKKSNTNIIQILLLISLGMITKLTIYISNHFLS